MSRRWAAVGAVALVVALVVAVRLSTAGSSGSGPTSMSGRTSSGQASEAVSAFVSAAAAPPRATTTFQPGIVDRPAVSTSVANILRVRTSWGGIVNGRQTMVYAGTDVSNPDSGMVMVYTGTLDAGSQLNPKEGLSVPGTGSFVIASADGDILTLVDGQGHTRQYDVTTRRFR